MKKYCLILLSALMLALAVGCTSSKPLRLSHYRKNVIVDKFCNIRVEGQKGLVDKNNLRQGLVMRMVAERSRIMIHVHLDVPREEFDDLLAELKAAGFRDLLFRDYRE